MASNEIVLDGDGVLFDYNKGVANLYKEILCNEPKLKEKGSYHVTNEYDFSEVKLTAGSFEDHLMSLFNKRDLWARLPAVEGAKEAIDIMVKKGYDVVCLTSMPKEYEKQRLANARLHNMQVSKVVAVDRAVAKEKGINNPKLNYIETYEPYAFVDDLLKNFVDMEEVKSKNKTRLIYLDNKYPDNPNKSYDESMVHEKITSLMDFAKSLPVYKE